ncbi:hypothetical protein [Deinococcus sp.]|uniref:hypothetical protein n=1 Tax=Deinococcus sp. TaxID=47478 RepID=UPI0028699F95|nr:hypothetical protein [Deinococcus sp.]
MSRREAATLLALSLAGSVALAATYTRVDITLTQSGGSLTVKTDPAAPPLLGVKTPAMRGNTASVNVAGPPRAWAVKLSPKVPLTLHVNRRGGAATLDLRAVPLTNLDIIQEGGQVSVLLPARSVSITVDQSQTDVRLTVPKTVGLRVQAPQFSHGQLIMNGKTMASGTDSDDRYESANYATAKQRIEVTLTMVDGTLDIR